MGGRDHLLEDGFLVEAAAQAPVEEAPRVLPLQRVADGAFGFHAARPVVQVRELEGDLRVDGEEQFLALRHFRFDARLLLR